MCLTTDDLVAHYPGSTALQLCHTFHPTRTTCPVVPENSAGIKQVTAVHVGADAKCHDDSLPGAALLRSIRTKALRRLRWTPMCAYPTTKGLWKECLA